MKNLIAALALTLPLALYCSGPAVAQTSDAGAPPPTAPRMQELTVVGTRESRSPGSAHILKSADLRRMDQSNPEAVVKAVPGVYARGEDGIGLRPNIGIRGTSPDRSKKVTLMEDGILFGPAPYSAPAAYYFPLINRMELVRIIKGPGAVEFGPHTVGGAVDLVTRRIPAQDSAGLDLATGQFGYRRLQGHFGASLGRAGFVLEGVHVGSTGFKDLDGGGDTGFSRNEWMWKGRYQLSEGARLSQELGLKLGYSDEDSRETYLGVSDADLRSTPSRRYRASALDRMLWHRTQMVATYHADLFRAFTIDIAAYRNDLQRTWRKLNRLGGGSIGTVLANPDGARNALLHSVLRGESDSTGPDDTLFVGPNQRVYVSQGVHARFGWRGLSGPVAHRLEIGSRFHYDRIERLHAEDGFLMRGGVLVADGLGSRTTANQRAWVHALALNVADAMTWGRVTLTPGIRAEIISANLKDRLHGQSQAGASQNVIVPGVGVYTALTSTLGVLAGVYRGFSPAAPGESASLRPETSVNYEGGLRFANEWMRVEGIGFFNDYQNLTALCTFSSGCTSADLDRQSDAGRAHIWGAEGFVRTQLPLSGGYVLPLMAAYTLTKTQLLEAFSSSDPTLGTVQPGDELPYIPLHQASATVALEHLRGSVAVGGTYGSATREIAGQGPIPSGLRTDESFVLDATFRLRLGARGEIYLLLRNALDAHDLVSRRPFGARPIAPRWVQVGTRWQL